MATTSRAESEVPSPFAAQAKRTADADAPIVDVHCHIGFPLYPMPAEPRFAFEALTASGQGAYLSERMLNRPGWRIAQRVLRRKWSGKSLNEAAEAFLDSHLLSTETVDKCVILAFDEAHDDEGRAMPRPERGRGAGSDMYVSNSLAWTYCEKARDRLLLGASIHPYRPNALEHLEEVASAGAVLIKWLPCVQNIDASDDRSLAFLARCRDLGLPVLVHYGPEHTLGVNRPEFVGPDHMLLGLRQLRRQGGMPTVIVAHVASSLSTWRHGESFKALREAMLGEFADAPLYADVSALTSPFKSGWMRRVLREEALWGKLVHGSDFPIPPSAWAFADRLGRQTRRLARTRNWLDRDVLIKRALGLPEEILRCGGVLLAQRMKTPGGGSA